MVGQGEVFGGGGGSGFSYVVEVVEDDDVVSDRGLGNKHCLLFFDGGGQTVSRGGDPKANKQL